MKLTATTLQLDRTTKIKVEKTKRDGTCLVFYTGSFLEHKDFVACTRRMGTEEAVITQLIEAYRKSQDGKAEIDLGIPAAPKPKFRVRQEQGKATRASLHDDFATALQYATKGTVVEWENDYWVCCLDIDFSEDTKPTERQLLSFCESVKPTPAFYWLSMSGGLHLIYYATEQFNASELAAVAGYLANRRFPQGKIEFLHRTRSPSKGYVDCIPDTEIGAIKSLLLQTTDTDAKSFLDERGWTPGMRLPHTECPVNPSRRSENNTDPVVIHDDHVFCYICKADKRRCGSNRAGWFSFAALSGNRVHTQIAECVRHFVHWGHAKHILKNHVPDEELGKKLYSTLMKLQHGEDARIPFVFTAGEPNGLVRYDGYWCDYSGKPLDIDKGSAILRQLPHTMTVNQSGITDIDQAACDWLVQTVNQGMRGYYALTPIHGIMLSQWQTTPGEKIYTVLQTATLAQESMANRRPKYLAGKDRMGVDQAWQVLDKYYPGIDCKLIELLLIGRGCTEHRTGIPPMLFITGPTGSGKSGHMEVAAAILGDTVSPVHLNRDRDRFNNEIFHAKQRSGFVFFDEFFKYAKRAMLSDVEAMENLLAYTENASVYLIYVGAVPMGFLPFFVWADTDIPREVQAHAQIGRRVFHYRLSNTLQWETALSEYGLLKPENLRTRGPEELLHAANTILSHIIDTYFTCPVTDFAEVASSTDGDEKLFPRVGKIQDSGATEDQTRLVKDLFDAVCNAPDIADANHRNRFSGRGNKLARADSICPVYTALDMCQTDDEKGTTKCRAVDEMDLQKRIGLVVPARVEIRKHGRTFAIRFVSEDGNLVNGELLQEGTQWDGKKCA